MSDFEKSINASDLIDWIMCAFPDWCVGGVRAIVDHIEKMPSAQPEITEEDVKKYCQERRFAIVDGELFEEMKARWSAQPVIRCKDCKHFGGGTYCHERDDMWDENDFCSYAERKGE